MQKEKLADEIKQQKAEVKKYESMLAEIKKRDSEKYQMKQLKKEPPILEEKDEFKNILSRVERCINLVDTDTAKCKMDLTNLKYYLKALLSEK